MNGFESYLPRRTPPWRRTLRTQLASNFKTPTTDELTVGADHQLLHRLRRVGDVHVSTRDRPSDAGTPRIGPRDLGARRHRDRNGRRRERIHAVRFNVPFYYLTLTIDATGDIFLNRPEATQNYNGIELSVVKRLSNKWMFRASGGWNHWTQNISPADIDPRSEQRLGPGGSEHERRHGRRLLGQDHHSGSTRGGSSTSRASTSSRWASTSAPTSSGGKAIRSPITSAPAAAAPTSTERATAT